MAGKSKEKTGTTARATRDPVAGIGPRIRNYRLERGMTLKQLGAATGLSHPFLSQVERGLARPSVRSIAAIARALQVPPEALWTDIGADRRRYVDVIRRAQAPVLSLSELTDEGTARVLTDEGQPFLVLELSGGSKEFMDSPRPRSSGDCLLYVVRGSVEANLDGSAHDLAEGDTLVFSGVIPSAFRNTGGQHTRALFVAARPRR
jgi:transcriptional regulator with XRE-family HTH domain